MFQNLTRSHPLHEKKWGHEIWYVNSDLYCLKRLVVKPGFRCSWHRHKKKDETFLCEEGFGVVEIEDRHMLRNGGPFIRAYYMEKGSSVHIPPDTWHRFKSYNGMTLLEVSTHHWDSDVERRDASGRIDEE